MRFGEQVFFPPKLYMPRLYLCVNCILLRVKCVWRALFHPLANPRPYLFRCAIVGVWLMLVHGCPRYPLTCSCAHKSAVVAVGAVAPCATRVQTIICASTSKIVRSLYVQYIHSLTPRDTAFTLPLPLGCLCAAGFLVIMRSLVGVSVWRICVGALAEGKTEHLVDFDI